MRNTEVDPFELCIELYGENPETALKYLAQQADIAGIRRQAATEFARVLEQSHNLAGKPDGVIAFCCADPAALLAKNNAAPPPAPAIDQQRYQAIKWLLETIRAPIKKYRKRPSPIRRAHSL